MKNMIQPLERTENPQNGFLKRILGSETEIIKLKSNQISAGIQLNVLDVFYSSITNEPEERTYLGFYPIEDNKEYLQLSFFPEYNNKEDGETYQIIQLVFSPTFFSQWSKEMMSQLQPFRFDRSIEQALSLPPCSRQPIQSLLSTNKNDFLLGLRKHELAVFLLRISLDAFLNPDEFSKLPACSFLNNSSEREKVLEAHNIILSRLENPITIRELARSVGINECYLKKGFKAMFGKTIHELQQFERIEKAKELLKLNKYSINEVAYKMGFGSPSHFSTSFKKIAGMKPCELLG